MVANIEPALNPCPDANIHMIINALNERSKLDDSGVALKWGK